MRFAATGTRASSLTLRKSIRSAMTDPIIASMAYIWPNPRHNARLCCIRPGPRGAGAALPLNTRKRSSSTARPSRYWPVRYARSGTLLRISGAIPTISAYLPAPLFIVAPTRAEAHDILDDYARHVSVAGQLALLSGWTGIDFSTYRPDQPIQYVESNAIQSMVENFTLRSDQPVRIGDLASLSHAGARSPFVVGSPRDVADELIAWADETDVDGFNLFRLVVPESLNAFVDLVVPELQSRGVYKTAYREGTLREKLFPGRGPLLHATHPGANFGRLSARMLPCSFHITSSTVVGASSTPTGIHAIIGQKK